MLPLSTYCRFTALAKSPENISNTLLKMKLIKVKVFPNSKKTEIRETKDKLIKINIAAPPEKDKANKELIKFFKKHFKLSVRIKSGKTSRDKTLEVI